MGVAIFTGFAVSSVSVASQRLTGSWEWYIIRGAGLVAAGLLLLLMISGIGQVTGLTYRFIEPVKAWILHKALAIALCVAIFIHVFFIIIDNFMKFSIPQVLVPYLSHYNNGTTLAGLALGGFAMSFGILAMYGVIIIVASSLGWIDTKQKAWRWLHYLGYLVFIDVFLHGLYAGTELKHDSIRLAWISFGLLIVVGIISRLWRAGTLSAKNK